MCNSLLENLNFELLTLLMPDLNPEAKALRDRISRYPDHTREELDRILRIEFQFVQLLDLILRSYALCPQIHKAIAHLEESRTWAGLSVKRGQQDGYQLSNYPQASQVTLAESRTIESSFEVVFNTILTRCVPNREMDLAIARLHDAKLALNLQLSK